MDFRSVRHQPPRGSTAWGAQQFLRLLDDEERIAAERQRLRAMGWRPQSSSESTAFHSDEPALSGADALYAAGALKEEALRRTGGIAGDATDIEDPDWNGGGRFPIPLPNSHLFHRVYANPVSRPLGGSGSRPMLGAPLGEPATPPPPRSRAATSLILTRGYSGEQPPHLPPDYVPRYFGLNDEIADRQFHRAAMYDWRIEEEARKRAKANGGEDDETIWARIADWFERSGDDASASSPPPDVEHPPSEAAQVRFVLNAFSAANIFLWESPATRQDNLDLIRMIKEEVRACNREAQHSHGAGKPERILRRPGGGLRGSRRPDGTVVIGNEGNPDYIWDFNTVDTWLSDEDHLTAREDRARIDIEELKAAIDAERRTRFDTYPKSRGKNRARWRARMRPRVRKAVRALLDC